MIAAIQVVATPTTVRLVVERVDSTGPPDCHSNVLPIASWPGHSRRAVDWETMTTGCVPARSKGVKSRPATMGS